MSKWQFKSWDNALWPLHRQHRVGVCKKHAKLLEGALDELGPGFLNGDKARVSRLLPDMGPFGDSCIKMAYPERSGVDIDSLLRACRQSKMLFTGITDLSYKLGLVSKHSFALLFETVTLTFSFCRQRGMSATMTVLGNMRWSWNRLMAIMRKLKTR